LLAFALKKKFLECRESELIGAKKNSRGWLTVQTACQNVALFRYQFNNRNFASQAKLCPVVTASLSPSQELAMMQMRTSIDVGLIYEAVFYNFGKEAENAFKAFHKHTINRLKWKRDDHEDKNTISKLISDLYKRDDS